MQLELIFGNEEKYKITYALSLTGNYSPKYTFKVGFLGALASVGSAAFCSHFGHEMVCDILSHHSPFTVDYFNTMAKGAGLLAGAGIGGLTGLLIASGLPGGEQRFEK